MTIAAAIPDVESVRPLVPVFAPRASDVEAGSVIVVIPAYNEERLVGRVIDDVSRHGFECVVVDDGSSDRTAAVARRAGATVIQHPINLGQGAALQTGIDWAVANGADRIVTFDADGQHSAAEIQLLLDALSQSGMDFALGSRFLGKAVNLPRARRLVLRAAIQFTRLVTRMALTDTHNGFRAMSRRGASFIRMRQNGMAHASEISNLIAASRLPWIEVPVTIEYTEYSLRKGQKTSGAAGILADLLMDRLSR